MKLIQSSGFYVLRKPLFPIQVLFDLLQINDELTFKSSLTKIAEDPNFKAAIYTSSPSLYVQVNNFLKEENTYGKINLQKTILKYIIRICSRPTPYGGFAGCSTVGKIAEKTEITFQENTFRHKRLDTRLMLDIQKFIVNRRDVKMKLKFFPNNSIYKVGEKYKYIYYGNINNKRDYSLCSFEASWYMEKVLNIAKSGASIDSIGRTLSINEIPYEVAENFIFDLIDEQILVSELDFTLTGKVFLIVLIERLDELGTFDDLVFFLKEIQNLLASGENEIILSEKIGKVLENNNISRSNDITIQTDLYFPTVKNTISESVIKNLGNKFQELLAINQANFNYDLENFKRKFLERYEDQEIPLLVALDFETGIGFGSGYNKDTGCLPLLQDIDCSEKQERSTIQWDFWKDFLLKKYSNSLLENDYEISLKQEDLKFLKENNPLSTQAPSSFSAFGNILARSQEDLDNNEYLFCLNLISGPSGANVVSRFCNGDENLKEELIEYLKIEEQSFPDSILAEIIHLPEEVAGNIVVRPTLRKYEIPVLAAASVDQEHQIRLDDIMVSIKDGRTIQLRSKRLNKKIIPRLSTTHNFTKGLGIYKFLSDLQYDDKYINIRWHWSILEKQKFLPRVTYQNIILSKATWNLAISDFSETSLKDYEKFFNRLLSKYKVPRFVTLSDGDNELLLDLENSTCKELLIEELEKKEVIVLKEYLQVPDQCFLRDRRGSYTNEIVIPFVNKVSTNHTVDFTHENCNINRKFGPGSEWLYFKIYTGEKTADKLLKTDLQFLITDLQEDGVIDQWFYCRYCDPDFHIRLRFHGNFENGFYNETTSRVFSFLNPYLDSNIIHKIQTDTYNREIERYGAETIESMEQIFFHDSNAILKFLDLLRSDSNEDLRWLFAIKGVNSLMDDFNCSLSNKTEILEFLCSNFSKEFKHIQDLKKQADTKYRYNCKQIEAFLEKEFSSNTLEYEANLIINERSSLNIKEIKAILQKTEATTHLLISSIHMFLNRLFISRPRLHEYIIYHHLNKYLRGVHAKMKQHHNV